jgi:hypothetical protein
MESYKIFNRGFENWKFSSRPRLTGDVSALKWKKKYNLSYV